MFNNDRRFKYEINNTFNNRFGSFLYQDKGIWAETNEQWDDAHGTASVDTESSLDLENEMMIYKLRKNLKYIIIFESGRTLLCNSNSSIGIGTYVVVEADRGEDVGIVLLQYGKDINSTAGYRDYEESKEELLNNTENKTETGRILENKLGMYKNTCTKLFFITNYIYSEEKKIIRIASDREINYLKERRMQESSALEYLNRVKEIYSVDMEITKCEYQFDCKRITFYYRSNKRIDFRELVKQLFKHFKIRIWMCSENREFYK